MIQSFGNVACLGKHLSVTLLNSELTDEIFFFSYSFGPRVALENESCRCHMVSSTPCCLNEVLLRQCISCLCVGACAWHLCKNSGLLSQFTDTRIRLVSKLFLFECEFGWLCVLMCNEVPTSLGCNKAAWLGLCDPSDPECRRGGSRKWTNWRITWSDNVPNLRGCPVLPSDLIRRLSPKQLPV